MKDSEFRPRHVNVIAFAAETGSESGQTDLASLERLYSALYLPDPAAALTPVSWSAQGELRKLRGGQAETWVHLQARTDTPLQCQRCLGVVTATLEIDRSFLFAPSEEVAAQWDGDRDDDVLVVSRNFDLTALIEDELLLALPLVPRHDACPTPVRLSVGEEDLLAESTSENPHPFAALAALRTPSPKD